MNQRQLWTTVALSMTVLGIPSVGRAQTARGNVADSQETPSPDVVKVGEYQSPTEKHNSAVVITEIHSHSIAGRQAATLFIKNIPVLTFLSSKPVANTDIKVGELGDAGTAQSYTSSTSDATKGVTVANTSKEIEVGNNDPVHRAGVVAAKINQLLWEKVDANKIVVSWKAGTESKVADGAMNKSNSAPEKVGDRYTIKINGSELVEINENTRLPDTTNNLAQDALQATNRIRRLMGNASPLNEVANLPSLSQASLAIGMPRLPFKVPQPKLPQDFGIGPIKFAMKGIASFYGYDGSGSKTASGERFHPEGMTAAHRSLPFGTRVRVTNTRNGRSVVVRITDRGPFIRGRVLDLSFGAARILGMIGNGVAPVRIEVLGK
jgi:rare lipoprotein A